MKGKILYKACQETPRENSGVGAWSAHPEGCGGAADCRPRSTYDVARQLRHCFAPGGGNLGAQRSALAEVERTRQEAATKKMTEKPERLAKPGKRLRGRKSHYACLA